MSYIEYLEMMGDDTSRMRSAEHVDFKTDEAYGTVFLKEGRPLLAYVYVWSGPGPEQLLNDRGYTVKELVPRGNGHFTCALDPDAVG